LWKKYARKSIFNTRRSLYLFALMWLT